MSEEFANHSEDMILPDDFQADETPTEPQEEQPSETPEEPAETPEDSPDEPEQSEDAPADETPQTLKIKFNHEEKDIPLDEARELAQKGMNYDKIQQQLNEIQNDPRLAFVEELAQAEGMDTSQFMDAFRQQQQQAQIDELVQQNIPEEYAREMVESRKDREERKREKEEQQKQQQQDQEAQEFFDYFKEANGRQFDSEKDEIPQEVWDMNQNGVPMKYAYMEYHNNQLNSQLQALKKTEENTKKAPVKGTTAHGTEEPTSDDLFLQGFNSV